MISYSYLDRTKNYKEKQNYSTLALWLAEFRFSSQQRKQSLVWLLVK